MVCLRQAKVLKRTKIDVMGDPQFGAALCGCGLLRADGCGGARRIAATSEAGDGTTGLCAVLSAAMKYSAVAFSFSTQWKLCIRSCQIVV